MEDYELSVITGTLSFVCRLSRGGGDGRLGTISDNWNRHLSVGYPEEVAMEDYELSVITGTLSFVCRLSRGGGNGRL